MKRLGKIALIVGTVFVALVIFGSILRVLGYGEPAAAPASPTATPSATTTTSTATSAPPTSTAPSAHPVAWMADLDAKCSAAGDRGAAHFTPDHATFTGLIGNTSNPDTNDFTWCVLRGLDAPLVDAKGQAIEWQDDGTWTWDREGAPVTVTSGWAPGEARMIKVTA